MLERRQIFDVPALSFEVIEHRVYTVVCACGQRHDSAFPAAVSELAQYLRGQFDNVFDTPLTARGVSSATQRRTLIKIKSPKGLLVTLRHR